MEQQENPTGTHHFNTWQECVLFHAKKYTDNKKPFFFDKKAVAKLIVSDNSPVPGCQGDEEWYYQNLIAWFRRSDKCQWNLNKGITVSGDFGVGKTMSMKIMANIFSKPKAQIKNVETDHIVRDFEKFGVKILDQYGRHSFNQNSRHHILYDEPILYCFHDLGREDIVVVNYGNKKSVMQKILADQYNLFTETGHKMIITTNDDADMLEAKYGLWERDRLREMTNWIKFEGTSKR